MKEHDEARAENTPQQFLDVANAIRCFAHNNIGSLPMVCERQLYSVLIPDAPQETRVTVDFAKYAVGFAIAIGGMRAHVIRLIRACAPDAAREELLEQFEIAIGQYGPAMERVLEVAGDSFGKPGKMYEGGEGDDATESD